MTRISAHDVLRTRLCVVAKCPNEARYGDHCFVHRDDPRPTAQRLLETTADPGPAPLRRSTSHRPPSPRELEILARLAAGDTNDEAAAAMQLSVETVKAHVKALLAKLGAANRAHVVAIGFRKGLLT